MEKAASLRAEKLTSRLINDFADLLDFFLGQFTGTLGRVNLGDSQGQESEAATETSDDTKTVSGLLLAVDVGVLHTQNVLEIVCVFDDES